MPDPIRLPAVRRARDHRRRAGIAGSVSRPGRSARACRNRRVKYEPQGEGSRQHQTYGRNPAKFAMSATATVASIMEAAIIR